MHKKYNAEACRFVSAVSPRFLHVGPTDHIDSLKKLETSISTCLTTGLRNHVLSFHFCIMFPWIRNIRIYL